ncbi:MAG TPA: alpha/beta fold hydrolase [Thermoanaerobaculia bacterium]|nr:alpha/beta fold hydrolase [Thermoanaerobaculia bacterium]
MITHRIEGEGEPVLLLNGGLMSIGAWEPIAVALAKRFHVIRCDFRGQLLSPGEPEPNLEVHVRDVVELLDGLGFQSVHIAGTSYGGLVALRLASLHPERVSSVAVIAGSDRITPELWESSAEMRDLALDSANGGDGGRVLEFILPGTYTPEYLEKQRSALAFHRNWVAGLPAIWFRGVASILSSLEGVDLTPHLGAIRSPTLILAGERDAMFPPERSRALAAAIPGARLEVVPGAPHGMVVENPDETARHLIDFLEKGFLETHRSGAPNA